MFNDYTLESEHRETEQQGQCQSLASEIARPQSEVQNLRSDLELIRLTNNSNFQRNTEFMKQIKELTEERVKLREQVIEARKEGTVRF